MAIARIRIVFDSDEEVTFERNIEFVDLCELRDKKFLAAYIFSEIEAQSRWGQYLSTLPSLDAFRRPVKHTFQLSEMASYEDRTNTFAVWREILNTMLHVRHLLAQSMAYDERERMQLSSQDPDAKELSWQIHMNKQERFDFAVGNLGKIRDLVARLVFERLGASLIDPRKPDWDKKIQLEIIRQRLSDRSNAHVASLSDAEYQELIKILDDFPSTEHVKRTRRYRNRITHHLKPSVDRSELYSHFANREGTPIVDEKGQVKGRKKSFGGLPSPEHSFADLYRDAVQSFEHYISLLKRLDAMPRFSLEATEPHVGA